MTWSPYWTVTAATVAALCLAPIVAAFQEDPSKEPAPTAGRAGGGGGIATLGNGIGPGRGPGAGTSQSLPPGVFQIGGSVSAPRIISKVEPQYDPAARDAGIEGEVWLSVVIDENGVPTQLQVTRSLHPGLDAEAIKAVSQRRFRPGIKEGVNVAVKATIAVSFRLSSPPPKPEAK